MGAFWGIRSSIRPVNRYPKLVTLKLQTSGSYIYGPLAAPSFGQGVRRSADFSKTDIAARILTSHHLYSPQRNPVKELRLKHTESMLKGQ